MDFLEQTINVLADLLILMLFIRVILSWFNVRHGWLIRFIYEATNPIIKPIQRALPRTGMIDFSPIIAFFLIELARSLLNSVL